MVVSVLIRVQLQEEVSHKVPHKVPPKLVLQALSALIQLLVLKLEEGCFSFHAIDMSYPIFETFGFE
jgi:hypothetical protein